MTKSTIEHFFFCEKKPKYLPDGDKLPLNIYLNKKKYLPVSGKLPLNIYLSKKQLNIYLFGGKLPMNIYLSKKRT